MWEVLSVVKVSVGMLGGCFGSGLQALFVLGLEWMIRSRIVLLSLVGKLVWVVQMSVRWMVRRLLVR